MIVTQINTETNTKAITKKDTEINNNRQNTTTRQVQFNVLEGFKYLTDVPSYAICIDLSYLDKKRHASFVLAQDLASRRVAGHFFKTTPVCTGDVMVFMEKIIEVRKGFAPIKYLHSDRESLFNNKLMYDFLEKHDIRKSSGSAKGHDNQTIERLNRTIKQKMERLLLDTPGIKVTKQNFSFEKINLHELETTLNEVIQTYNDTAHPANHQMSPNNFDDSLVEYIANGNPTAPVALARNKERNKLESTEAQNIKLVRRAVALQFGNNWEQFFMFLKKDTTNILYQTQMLLEQNQDFKSEIGTLKTTINFLSDEALINKDIRLKKAAAKEKRQHALTQPLRDTITLDDFEYILTLCPPKTYKNNRKRLALGLLYMTGLRVSNLLILTVKNVQSLLSEGCMQITLNKRGDKRHRIELSAAGVTFINRLKKEFKKLSKGKTINQFIFTAQSDNSKPISRENYDKELNITLKEASVVLGKHLRTHSFRATFITDLLKSTPLHKVRDIIGHKDIKSTFTYSRGALTREHINKVMEDLMRGRLKESKKNIKV